MNLRGVRESGAFFAIPTYGFVVGVLVMLVIGMARYFGFFGLPPLPVNTNSTVPHGQSGGFCLHLADPAGFFRWVHRPDRDRSDQQWGQSLQKTRIQERGHGDDRYGYDRHRSLIGIAYLSTKIDLIPEASESVLSQLTRAVTGSGFLYFWVQIFTAGILFMAANTGFQDFPRFSYFLARDNYLPRWFQNRGDRLVFSSGIAALTLLSAVMLILFQADEIRCCPFMHWA